MAKRLEFDEEAAIADRLRRWSMVHTPGDVAEERPIRSIGRADSSHADGVSPPCRLCIVHLIQITPGLRPAPNIVYDFTIPELTDRTLATLHGQQHRIEGPYRGYRFTGQGHAGQRDPSQYLRPFGAAQLVSSIYSRCLDPLRFESAGAAKLTRVDVFESFARKLFGDRVAGAMELISSGLDNIRVLDLYQPGIGSATARWLQHLAGEALETDSMRPQLYAPIQQRNLRAALVTIRESVTVVDRYAALSRGSS
jgi:hypothetical protein